MWRLWHFLFGWDYIASRCLFHTNIVRVFRVPDGTIVCDSGNHLRKLGDPSNVVWLTCKQEKYFPETNEAGEK